MRATTTEIDPSDRFDMDRHTFFEVPNTDWTQDVPPIAGTTDVHPARCSCLPCQAEAEFEAFEAQWSEDEDGSHAFALMLERRAENGTWWGR